MATLANENCNQDTELKLKDKEMLFSRPRVNLFRISRV